MRPVGSGAQRSVLLVEDQEVVRELLRRVLEEEGYLVHVARDGSHALEVAAAVDGEIDLLLTDLVMPNLGGPELAARLADVRAVGATIFMSGYAGDSLADSGSLPPGAEFIQKPFRPAELLQRVEAVLDS
jgi:two-component system, cell cycle sensor histidine kinase and response regulator CckA